MKAFKLGNVQYKSRSQAAVAMARNSKLTNSEIATKVGMTPQTVSAAIRLSMNKDLMADVKKQ